MSFEAVPCMFRRSAGDGNGETEYVGLIIRPSSSSVQPNQQQSAPTSSMAPSLVRHTLPPGAKPPQQLQYVNTATIQLQPGANGGPPKVLMPAGRLPMLKSMPSGGVQGQFSPQQTRCLSSSSASSFVDPSPMSPMAYVHTPPGQPYVYAQPSTSASPSVRHDTTPRRRSGGGASSGSVSGGAWPHQQSDSSTTPDSGIQSVPGSPPVHHEQLPALTECSSSVCEGEDFADMPRLLPAEMADGGASPQSCPLLRASLDGGSAHGSECETAATPSISLHPNMAPDEIAQQLMLAMDPEKVKHVTQLISKAARKRSSSRVAEKPKKKRKEEVKDDRPESATSEEPRGQSEIERVDSPAQRTRSRKGDRMTPSMASPVPSTSGALLRSLTPSSVLSEPSTSTKMEPEEEVMDEKPYVKPTPTSIAEYRRLAREKLNRLLERDVDAMREDLSNLYLAHKKSMRKRTNSVSVKAFSFDKSKVKPCAFKLDLPTRVVSTAETPQQQKRKRVVEKEEQRPSEKRRSSEVKRKEEKRRRMSECGERRSSSVVSSSHSRHHSFSSPKKRRDEDVPEETDEMTECILADSPTGALAFSPSCSSSSTGCCCRALRMQCAAGGKVFKRDAVSQLVVAGARGKRLVRTRNTRKGGEFLCEFVGDVVAGEEMATRMERYEKLDGVTPRALCLSPTAWVDATRRGSIARYIRHSCQPNAELQVWCVAGRLRLGVFARGDISSSSEVCVDMDGWLWSGRRCDPDCPQTKCRRRVHEARLARVAASPSMSRSERDEMSDSRRLLPSNIRHAIRAAVHNRLATPFPSSPLPANPSLLECYRVVWEGLERLARAVDGSLRPQWKRGWHECKRAYSEGDGTAFGEALQRWVDDINEPVVDVAYGQLRAKYLEAKTKKQERDRVLNIETDLAYLDSKHAVGSYSPDGGGVWRAGVADGDDDAVRCVCGTTDDDGEMVQCDACQYWLHSECLRDFDGGDNGYACSFCASPDPRLEECGPCCDVELKQPPEYNNKHFTYYKALMTHSGVQVRLNETVYVQKVTGEEHKKLLKKAQDGGEPPWKEKGKKGERAESSRRDLRTMRVERLFETKGGHRFLFGFYYARPHETYCDPNRLFNRQELFATPLYDTLPLDSVAGRCVVLDSTVWTIGRTLVPKYKEEDVFVCDYQIDKHQRSFERIPAKNRYHTSTHHRVFARFGKPKHLTRDFTPFILEGHRAASSHTKDEAGDRFRKMSERRVSSVLDRLRAAARLH